MSSCFPFIFPPSGPSAIYTLSLHDALPIYLTGGVMAALGGMPVRQFLASHNANDFFPRHLTDGSTEWLPSKRTYSNAMDVGVPSNFERLQHLLTADDLRRLIRGFSVSDDDTLASMRRVADECGYIADPHTAVRSEEHTSELQSRGHLVCRLLLLFNTMGKPNQLSLT